MRTLTPKELARMAAIAGLDIDRKPEPTKHGEPYAKRDEGRKRRNDRRAVRAMKRGFFA